MIDLKFVGAESLKKYIHVAMQIASCCYVCYFFSCFIPVCKERLKQQRKEKAARSAKQKEIFHHEILGTSWDSKGCDLMDLMFFKARGQGLVGFSFGISPLVNARPVWDPITPNNKPTSRQKAREMRRSQMEHDGIGKIEV